LLRLVDVADSLACELSELMLLFNEKDMLFIPPKSFHFCSAIPSLFALKRRSASNELIERSRKNFRRKVELDCNSCEVDKKEVDKKTAERPYALVEGLCPPWHLPPVCVRAATAPIFWA
jgi:hypothetical protein